MNKNVILKKCRHCISCVGKVCKKYNKPVDADMCISCEKDKRIMCCFCENWNPQESICKKLSTNNFKTGDSLRICNMFSLITKKKKK